MIRRAEIITSLSIVVCEWVWNQYLQSNETAKGGFGILFWRQGETMGMLCSLLYQSGAFRWKDGEKEKTKYTYFIYDSVASVLKSDFKAHDLHLSVSTFATAVQWEILCFRQKYIYCIHVCVYVYMLLLRSRFDNKGLFCLCVDLLHLLKWKIWILLLLLLLSRRLGIKAKEKKDCWWSDWNSQGQSQSCQTV